jgi:hypothetical protein
MAENRDKTQKSVPVVPLTGTLESMLRRFRGAIGRGQATPPAPSPAGGRPRRSQVPSCKSIVCTRRSRRSDDL